MNLSGLSFVRVVMAAIPLICVWVPAFASDAPSMPDEAVLNRVHTFTGLDTMFEVETIESVPATAARIPFLEKALEGQTAIKVTLKRGKLKLRAARVGVKDEYDDRQFIVILSGDAKNLLSVTSSISKRNPEIHPEESLGNVEMELGRVESYKSFPPLDPKITFLEALEAIQKPGNPGPFDAQEIEGFYVIHFELNHAPRSEWIVTLRGMPPLPGTPGPPLPAGFPPDARKHDPAPIWMRNHERYFVDATTGQPLGAVNSPRAKP